MRNNGFTLIELLIVVVIVGILASISYANFIGAQDKARSAALKAVMRQVQISAESYATDSGGSYPPELAAMQPYFPGGSSSIGGNPGQWPSNPFVNGANFGSPDPPDDDESITDISAARAMAPGTFADDPGGVVYDHALNPSSYAIWGCGADGRCLGDGRGQLILSNQ